MFSVCVDNDPFALVQSAAAGGGEVCVGLRTLARADGGRAQGAWARPPLWMDSRKGIGCARTDFFVRTDTARYQRRIRTIQKSVLAKYPEDQLFTKSRVVENSTRVYSTY